LARAIAPNVRFRKSPSKYGEERRIKVRVVTVGQSKAHMEGALHFIFTFIFDSLSVCNLKIITLLSYKIQKSLENLLAQLAQE
jgi:hypothetical protein